MKVLHLAKSDQEGGAAKAAYRIHRGLVQKGIDSWMLVDKKLSIDPRVIAPVTLLEKLVAKVSTRIERYPLSWLHTENQTYHSLAWLSSPMLKRIPSIKPNIINLHWICNGFLRPANLLQFQEPLVWRLADMWPLAGSEHYVGDSTRYKEGYLRTNRPKRDSGLDLDRWVWKRKVRAWQNVENLTIVTPSRWLAKIARESLLFQERRIEVIPTGQDTDLYRPINKNIAREFLNLPQDKTLILFGAVNPSGEKRKGFHLLKSALEVLAHSQFSSRFELIVFGGGWNSNCLEGKWKTYSLGKLSDDQRLVAMYSAADVFVAPSTEENLANTVIESMACGTPVVAFKIGGMSDIIHHTKNGYLARPFEVEDLAHGISWIFKDETRWRELSIRAREIVEVEFSMKVQAKRYANLYSDLLATPFTKSSKPRTIALPAVSREKQSS